GIRDFHVTGVQTCALPICIDADGEARHALVLGSRTHYYESRDVRAVAHGVRTAAAAGVQRLVLTNGCGGLDPAVAPGTPVLISEDRKSVGEGSGGDARGRS